MRRHLILVVRCQMKILINLFFASLLFFCTSDSGVAKERVSNALPATLYASKFDLLSIRSRFSSKDEYKNQSGVDWNISLKPGSYRIDYMCESLPNEIRINENDTFRYIKLRSGKKYRLFCDEKKFGIMHIKEVTSN